MNLRERYDRILTTLANLRDRGLVTDFFTSDRGARLSIVGPGYYRVVQGVSAQETFIEGMMTVIVAQTEKGDQI
jgi:hypothetical protein